MRSYNGIHNTGKIQTETTYQNGTKNGSYVKYYKTGKLQETGNYQNGKKRESLVLIIKILT